MSPQNIVSWVVGVLVLIAAVVGLVYAITTHTEPGLMATTPGFGPNDLPIRVCVAAYVPDPRASRDALQAVDQAVGTTNGRSGAQVFEVELQGEQACPVTITVGAPTEHAAHQDPGGDAQFTNGARECAVTMRNNGTTTMLDLDLQHELGHCLGLAHDCWAGSIMCGDENNDPSDGSCCTLAPSPDGTYPPRIDDSDRALLRSALGIR